jgi:hypothetical protein
MRKTTSGLSRLSIWGSRTRESSGTLKSHAFSYLQVQSGNATRNGFSFLEVQVALLLFGVTLAGLGPLVVMQLKQLEKIEGRFSDRTTHYLVPTTDPWARKLGAAASISIKKLNPGTPLLLNQTPPVNDVSIVSIAKSLTSEEVTAHVSVTVIPSGGGILGNGNGKKGKAK